MRTRANFGVVGPVQTQTAVSTGRVYSIDDQKLNKAQGKWADAYSAQFAISPAVNGKTTWDTGVDGPLSLSSSGTWTITPVSTFSGVVAMWGAGGGTGASGGSGGAGGFTSGVITLTQGTTYTVLVGQGGRAGSGGTALGGGGGGDTYRGGGGGYTGLFEGTTISQAAARMMAGGGGGSGGDANNSADIEQGGAGGGTSGQQGSPNASAYHPVPGTQTTGNAPLTGAGRLSGGGGGYYGGEGGVDSGPYASGGGGGSGYIHSSVSGGVTTTGDRTVPAESSNPLRGTAGTPYTGTSGNGNSGLFYLTK